jgi:uncharacterized protein YjbI with pentapeptide repeats
MNRDEAMKLLLSGEEGIRIWNYYCESNIEIPDLSRAIFSEANLTQANLTRVNLFEAYLFKTDLTRAILYKTNLAGAKLTGAKLTGAKLISADLIDADLMWADLTGADFTSAKLNRANFTHARLSETKLAGADFTRAKLVGADFTKAKFAGAILTEADLTGADFTRAQLGGATCGLNAFVNLDLTQPRGLDQVFHSNPSILDVNTLFRSKGQIPEAFLRGCGLTPWEVLSSRLYDTTLTPPQFIEIQYKVFDAWTKGRNMINGYFISYSWKDSHFVEKLRDHLMVEGVNVWLDRHDMVAGTIQDQVWRAIQLHHVVILVLSEDSVKSDWVENELDMARQKEKAEGRAVLCPVALDDAWKTKLDASGGPGDPSRALWRTLQTKLVMDFSPWKTKAFDATFGKLVRGLKVNYGPQGSTTS